MADQTSDQSTITFKEAVPILFFAQHNDLARIDYDIFCNALSEKKVPWDFDDKRFLLELKSLQERIVGRLGFKNNENLQKNADETLVNTLPPDELDEMGEGLEEIKLQRSVHQKKIRDYTEKIVKKYIEDSKAQGVDVSPEQELTIQAAAIQAEQKSIDDLKEHLSSLTAAPVEIPPEVEEAAAKASRLTEVTKTVLTNEGNHKGRLVKQCLANLETPPEIIADKNIEASTAKAVALPEEIKQEINKMLDNPTDQQKKALRQAWESTGELSGEFINAVKSKEFIDDAISWITGDSLKKIKDKARVDGKPIDSKKLEPIEQWLAQKEAIRKASKSFFNQALFASAATVLGPKIQAGLMAYLETTMVMTAANAPKYLMYFTLAGTDVWNTILGRSTRVAATKAAEKAAGAFAGTLLEKGVEKSVWVTLKRILGRVIGGIPGLILTGLSVVWSGIRGLFSFLQFRGFERGIIQGFGMAAPRKKNWWEDMGLLLGVVFIIVVFVIAGFVYYMRYAFTIAQFMEERDKTTTAEGGGGGAIEALGLYRSRLGGGGQEKAPVPFYCDPTTNPSCAVPKCEPDPNNPAKCEWAVSCGVVSQAPGQTGGSHSQNNLNAIDILTDGCGGHVDVHAIYDGVVVRVIDTFGEGDHDGAGGGYGNRVIVKATDKNGNEFLIMYAHLWYVAQSEQAGGQRSLQPGDIIKKGDAIGKTNNNGYSDIDHLHLEVRNGDGSIGGPNINQLLPVEVPAGCYNYGGKLCGITIGS